MTGRSCVTFTKCKDMCDSFAVELFWFERCGPLDYITLAKLSESRASLLQESEDIDSFREFKSDF